jgi:hypothetical protein
MPFICWATIISTRYYMATSIVLFCSLSQTNIYRIYQNGTIWLYYAALNARFSTYFHPQPVPRVYMFVSIMKTISSRGSRILQTIHTIYQWLSWKPLCKSLYHTQNTHTGNSGCHGNQSVTHRITHIRLLRNISHVLVIRRAAVLFAYYTIYNVPVLGEIMKIFKVNNKFGQMFSLWHYKSVSLLQHHFTISLSDFSYVRFNFWISMFISPYLELPPHFDRNCRLF